MNQKQKEELRARCEAIIKGNSKRRSWPFSGKSIQKLLKSTGKGDALPYMGKGRAYRLARGRNITKLLYLYLKFLIEESLKYPIQIYIPYVGILSIVEVDPVGKKSLWAENGKLVYRMDTPFDTSVKYWMRSYIFGIEHADFTTSYKLRKSYINPILRKVYLAHPDGGFYEKEGTWNY